ncbi:MAG: porin [Alphaproteobacteria bacterium]|nr:porin [Alphaproteobacteria bacterium]
MTFFCSSLLVRSTKQSIFLPTPISWIASRFALAMILFCYFPILAHSKPTLTANGFVDFSAAVHDQTIKNHIYRNKVVGNDSQLFLKAMMPLDGVKYGAVTKFEMNYNSDKRNENPNLDQAFIFVEGWLGKVEFGNNQAVNQKVKAGTSRLVRGAGGINGKYLENVNLPDSEFILLAQSPIGHGGYSKSALRPYARSQFRALKDDSFDGVEDATKISYYSPRIKGLQLAASYAPNSGNIGVTKQTVRDANFVKIENIFSAAASYEEDFDNLTVELSATAEHGHSRSTRHGNLFAYDFGSSLSYFGFTIGATYSSWGKSLQTDPKTNTSYYTLGISYRFGPFATSLSNLESTCQKNKYSATSLGFDYKLTRDLMPYFELTNFSFDPSSQAVASNRGYAVLTGILFSF